MKRTLKKPSRKLKQTRTPQSKEFPTVRPRPARVENTPLEPCELDEPCTSTENEIFAENERRVRINLKRCMYKIVEEISVANGMDVVRDDDASWDVNWSDASLSTNLSKSMDVFQRINHIPGLANLESKAYLAHHLNRMRALFPEAYDFFPRSFSLPWQLEDLLAYMRKNPTLVFIVKPTRGAEGKGIKLISSVEEAKRVNFQSVVQAYVPNLLLMDGYKFDLRVYVMITSVDPLRIFVYNNGLVRLATYLYSKPDNTNINNQFMHLTNYSINKNSDKYNDSPENGSKRDFIAFNAWLAKRGWNSAKLWSQIDDVIIKTIICVYPLLKEKYGELFPDQYQHSISACFELLGVDILIDSSMKPFLLEVNRSPSFNIAGVIDERVKKNLLQDSFTLLNLNYDRRSLWTLVEEEVRDPLNPFGSSDEKSKKSFKLVANGETKESCLTVQDQIKWEAANGGNFRMIYPNPKNSHEYARFINQLFSPSEGGKK